MSGVVQMQWALNEQGALTNIDSHGLKRGLACDCTCPSCGQSLIARIGDERAHHFAHQNSGDAICKFALETELHIRAKHLIEERLQVALPLHVSKYDRSAFELFSITDVKVEKFHLGKKPDLIVSIDGAQYLIEIAVTHFVEDEKIKHYRQHHLSAAEFNLAGLRTSDDLDGALAKVLFNPDSDSSIYWLSLSPLTPIGQKVMARLRSEAIGIKAEIKKAEKTLRELTANNRKLEKSNKDLEKRKSELQKIVGLMDSLAEIRFEVVNQQQRLHQINEMHRDPDMVNTQLLRRERELEQAEKNLSDRQLSFLKQERELSALDKKNRRHLVEQDKLIEQQWKELIDAMHAIANIDNDFRHAGLLLNDVQAVRERIINQVRHEELYERKIQICSEEFSKINDKKMRLEEEISGILKNKDFYQQEVAKLHRELKEIQSR